MGRGDDRITSAADIKKLGTILSVWAHPDDESFLAAGIMAAAVRNGQTVACVTATKGEAGSQDEKKWPSATLADVRAREMAAALKLLGITHHHWLGYHDGECDQVSPAEAAAKIRKFIEKYQPDSILTFGPEGWTGHGDHAAVSRWVSAAIKGSRPQPAVYHYIGTPGWYELIKAADEKLNIFFNINHPPIVEVSRCGIYFSLPAEICELKYQALGASPSQTEVLLKYFDRKFLEQAFAIETYVKCKIDKK
jgi:LmbE family N-acetylglucosaminyl deacetylase